MPKNTLIISEHIGTSAATNDGGQEFNFDLGFSIFQRDPVVKCKETGKTFALPWSHILDLAEDAGIMRPHGEPLQKTDKAVEDKLFITEIINDLYRNDFVSGGKAQVMLHDWARELRKATRRFFPASRLRRTHEEVVGKGLW